MKRNERKYDFFKKNVSRPSNPPDELAQKCFEKKKLFGRIVPPYFCSKVLNLTVFSIIYTIRIRFFGSGE